MWTSALHRIQMTRNKCKLGKIDKSWKKCYMDVDVCYTVQHVCNGNF